MITWSDGSDDGGNVWAVEQYGAAGGLLTQQRRTLETSSRDLVLRWQSGGLKRQVIFHPDPSLKVTV